MGSAGGRRWKQLDADGRSIFILCPYPSICKVGLYNLNDSIEGPATFTFLSDEDFSDELKLFLGIFFTNYNDFCIYQILHFIVSVFFVSFHISDFLGGFSILRI